MNDSHTLAALRERYGPRYRWLLLLSVMIGTMASIMSSTVVNVAIPSMSQQFHLGQETAHWVASGFMVAMTVSMLTTPWLLMRFGYRRTYVATMLLLMAGGILGGFAMHFELVLLARILEGLAAGVVQPIPAIILLRAFESHEQGRASGWFGFGVVLAPAIGPSVGGLLVDAYGWRSIFFMVIPFCLVSLALAFRYVPTTAPGGGQAKQDDSTLDWLGLALVSVGTLCLLNGLTQLHQGDPKLAYGLIVAAIVATIGFIVWQGKADVPLMNLRLYQHRRFAMGGIVAFIYGMALFGSTYLIPVFMQLALSLSPSEAGKILMPAGIVLAITMGGVGRLVNKWSTHVLVSAGLAMLTLSFLLMMTVGSGTALFQLMCWAVLGRIGLGFILPSLNIGAMRDLENELISQGASTINFIRMVGGATGVSLCGIVLDWRISVHGDSLSQLATSVGRVAAFHETFILLAGLCTIAIIAAWRMQGNQLFLEG